MTYLNDSNISSSCVACDESKLCISNNVSQIEVIYDIQHDHVRKSKGLFILPQGSQEKIFIFFVL